MKQPLYVRIANLIEAIHNCEKQGNTEWRERHINTLELLRRDSPPSGSGFDNGTFLIREASDDKRLTFRTSFHHMNDHGTYIGWTEHKVIVRPSLLHGIVVSVTGRNQNGIVDYIAEVFQQCLTEEA